MNVDFSTAAETQAGIRAFIEQAADFMAAAGLASAKVTGDPAAYAIEQWCTILKREALLRVRVKQREDDRLNAPTLAALSDMRDLLP